MIDFGMLRRFRRTSLSALFVGVVTLLSACSSSDKRPLVLIQAPLGNFAGTAYQVDITVTVGGIPHGKTILASEYGAGNVGIYLDAGTSGEATVSVVVTDVAGCTIATGNSTAPVRVEPGETTQVVSIVLLAAAIPCGVADSGVPPEGDAATQTDTSDGGMSPDEAGVSPADTRPAGLDVPVEVGSLSDAGAVDVGMPAEARPETPPSPDAPSDSVVAPDLPTLDAATDPPPAPTDLPVVVDVGPDGTSDVPTTANVFAHCSTYKHSESEQGTPGNYLSVSGILFTPDKKNLISLGNDGRAKVWDITPAGLATPANGLEFAGSYWLRGAIGMDGKYLGIGDSDGNVVVYDLPLSIASGAAVEVASLSWELLPYRGADPRPMGFTTDGNHLVVRYDSYYLGDPMQVAIWDLTTRAVARQLDMRNDEEYPMAFLPGDFSTSMWLASEETVSSDAGWDTLVTLRDMSKTPISTVQFTIPASDGWAMAFSPDGSTLAVGFGDAEVSLWDISNKSMIAQLGSPLIVGGTSNWINDLVYSADGRYVAAAIGGWSSNYSVKLASVLPPRQTLTKSLDYDGFCVDLSRDGLALAVGESDHGIIVYCTP
jgi:hypothetical protein